MAFETDNYFDYNANVSIAIWAYRSAGWQQVTTDFIYVEGGTTYGNEGLKTFNWSVNNRVYQLGSDVQKVGVAIESHTGWSASLDSFTLLAWQAQGSSGGVRSATPNGEKTTVTVTP